jgi:hypothetical protein
MRHLRITLDFETEGETVAALEELRFYLAGVVAHQDLGTQLGPRDLERAGFTGVRLVGADVEEPAEGG